MASRTRYTTTARVWRCRCADGRTQRQQQRTTDCGDPRRPVTRARLSIDHILGLTWPLLARHAKAVRGHTCTAGELG